MTKINSIIIDDEKKARQLLEIILEENCPQISVIDKCEDLPSAIKSIKKNKPDLIFLDIEMPGFSGLQLLDFFNDDEISFSIIFVTAYDNYAIQAFKLSAIDYILKPINVSLLVEAVNRFEKHQNKLSLKLNALKNNLEQTDKKIVIPGRDSVSMISPLDILYIKADGAYSNFYLKNSKKIMMSRNLKYIEDLITDFSYLKRCHKSFIVNTKEIQSYNRSKSELILSDSSLVSISEDRVAEIIN